MLADGFQVGFGRADRGVRPGDKGRLVTDGSDPGSGFAAHHHSLPLQPIRQARRRSFALGGLGFRQCLDGAIFVALGPKVFLTAVALDATLIFWR